VSAHARRLPAPMTKPYRYATAEPGHDRAGRQRRPGKLLGKSCPKLKDSKHGQ
jgi:hypothetical protein